MHQVAEGDKNARLLVVQSHKPSEGMEKWFLKKLFDECKILRQDVRFVYMLDEAPKSSGGRSTREQIKRSWDRFLLEIEASSPEVVLVLGGEPLYFLTGIREGIHTARGYVLTKKFFKDISWKVREQIGVYKTNNKTRGISKGDPKFGDVLKNFPGLLGADYNGIVVPTYTLDHIRTEGFAVEPAFKVDIQRVKRALDKKLTRIDENIVYYTDFFHVEKQGTGKTLVSLSLDNIPWKSDVIAVDIETEGMKNDVINRVSISDGYVTASIAWDSKAVKLLNELFSRVDARFALHNSGFDLPRLKEHGVDISQYTLDNQIFDTMYGAVMIQPDLMKGLGAAITIYCDCEPWKWQELQDADPIYYSAKDAFMTAWLARQEITVLKKMGMWDLATGGANFPGPGVMATIPVLTEMGRHGIRTNKEYAKKWLPRLERHLFRLEKLWTRMFGNLSAHSPKQVAGLLYKTWKLPTQKTRDDKISTDELSLTRLKFYIQSDYAAVHDNEIWKTDKRCNARTFDLLLRLRDISKTISTYVQPVIEGEETRVYPQYLPASKDSETGSHNMTSKGNTATGRLATFRPNIGNQPEKTRILYVPDRDDMCFIQGDWKAAELWTFGFLSGDLRLLNDLRSNDLHRLNADRFNITRDVAKNVNYARQYLAGPTKINEMLMRQAHMYVPVEECKRIINGLAEYYFIETAYKKHLVELCGTKKYIRNPFGRIRIFHNNEAPAAVNFVAQSNIADCLWCLLKKISDMAKFYGGSLVTTVYDSVLIQVPQEFVKDAAQDLKEIMETKFEIVADDFFLPVELKVGEPGKSWAELEKYGL